jgi:hypothetical protein
MFSPYLSKKYILRNQRTFHEIQALHTFPKNFRSEKCLTGQRQTAFAELQCLEKWVSLNLVAIFLALSSVFYSLAVGNSNQN